MFVFSVTLNYSQCTWNFLLHKNWILNRRDIESLAAIPGFLRKGWMGVRSVVWSSLLWLQKNLNNNYYIYKCTNRHLFTNNINGWLYLNCSCVNELCEENIHVLTVSKMPFTWWPYFIQTFNRKDMINHFYGWLSLF